MPYRLLVVLVLSSLVIWGAGPLPFWAVMGVVAGVGWLVFHAPSLLPKFEEPSPNEGKVVSLDAYRKQREHERKVQEQGSGLRLVYESPVLHEADLTASLLEHHGIAVHVFNRHNASILIHPMGEMMVKVMVSQADWPRARRLIEDQSSRMPPEDFSTA